MSREYEVQEQACICLYVPGVFGAYAIIDTEKITFIIFLKRQKMHGRDAWRERRIISPWAGFGLVNSQVSTVIYAAYEQQAAERAGQGAVKP